MRLIASFMTVIFFAYFVNPAAATSCSERHKNCIDNCVKYYIPKCISSGCFVTPHKQMWIYEELRTCKSTPFADRRDRHDSAGQCIGRVHAAFRHSLSCNSASAAGPDQDIRG
jgi:hypothetical protein